MDRTTAPGLTTSVVQARRKAGYLEYGIDDLDCMARASADGDTKWHMLECKLADKRHIRKGLWAIDTTNPNAWTKAQELLKSTRARLRDYLASIQ